VCCGVVPFYSLSLWCSYNPKRHQSASTCCNTLQHTAPQRDTIQVAWQGGFRHKCNYTAPCTVHTGTHTHKPAGDKWSRNSEAPPPSPTRGDSASPPPCWGGADIGGDKHAAASPRALYSPVFVCLSVCPPPQVAPVDEVR